MLFAVSDESHPQLSGARADATYSYIVKVSTRTPVSTRHKDRVQAPVSAPAPTPPGSNCAGGCHVLGSSPVNACLETGFRLLGSSPVVGSAREVDCWGGRARVRRRLHRVSALLVSGRPYDRWRAHTCARLASRVGLATRLARGSFGLVPSRSSGTDQTEKELRNLNGAEADPTERELENWNGVGADPTERELGNLNSARADPTECELGNLNSAGADPTEQELGSLNGAVGADPTEQELGNKNGFCQG
ncbi:hypothetical protein BHE74_00052809 [Ensete ventricosum]|nr:hypothetical protein BHE74_00052809 [Ensete ventricosum]